MLNPYATFLGNRTALEVLPTTPDKLHAVLEQLGPKGVEQNPAPGKWSAREIVSHLADCEIAFGFRLRQTLAEDNHVIQPFDQEKWAANYAAYDASTALAAFAAVRQWNLALIKSVTPEKQTKPATHPERGTMTFLTIVETMAGHDLNHLQQLENMKQPLSPA
jgi:uncharacterized damage-inducible protein DinB